VNFQNYEPYFLLLVGIIIGVIIGRLGAIRPLFQNGYLEANFISEYDEWATNLSEKNFHALVWAVGDYSCRAPALSLVIDGELDIAEVRGHYIFRRAVLALQTIEGIGRGENISLAEFKQRIRSLNEDFRKGVEHPGNKG